MKIAVTYDKDNGTVFQHFGHSEAFKVYQVEDGEVGAGEVMGTDGAGHEALAGVLKNHDIDVLLCGGMGSGAQAALAEAGIEVCSGVTGDADQAVADYLAGKLESAGVNCDHHD
ncbi:MAG: NifB/NifX family molybdenum-iron cluster-binding protein, partial [Clostridia bacterium]